MRPELYIGDDVSKQRSVLIGERLRNAHMHIIGRSNTGKTSHIIHMIRKDIVNGRGLCVIDMLGNLYPRLVSFLAYYGLADRVILFNPSDTEYSPGLNYLDTFGGSLEVSTVVETAMEGIMRVYKEQSDAVKPRWETYAPITLEPLVREGLTLLEIFPFSSPHVDTMRRKLLARHSEFHLRHGWKEFDSQTSNSKKFELVEVVYNRGMRFWPNPLVRRIVGQRRNFVDWRSAMDEGKVVLCNLGTTGSLTSKQAQMLGVMLLHQIVNAAKTRRGQDPRRFYLYVDEFPQILCKDFETAPDILRNFGVSLILAHQRLGQLRQELQDIDVHSALMANARIKEVFSIHQADAEIMAKEVFGEYIHGDDVKYQGRRTMLVPRQEIITLRGKSRSSSAGSGYGDSVTSYSEGVLFDSDSSLDSRHSWGSSSHGPTSQSYDASGEADSEHESLRTVHDREYEDETPVFTSIEEKTWQYVRQILGQKQRESILLLPHIHPVSITTPLVRDYHGSESEIRAFVKDVNRKNGVPLAQEAERQIESRYRQLFGNDFAQFWSTLESAPRVEPPESDDDRWQ